MKVARQFIAWYVSPKRPVPQGRCEGCPLVRLFLKFNMLRSSSFLPSIPTILSKAGMFQALVKAV
jgi:hypothetical protein